MIPASSADLAAMADRLARHTPWDTDEARSLGRMKVLATAPDCFERDRWGGHFTASAWIVNPARSHVLLTHHRKLLKWLQLGGHCDGDPRVERVALREAHEESGLPESAFRFLRPDLFDVSVHLIPARPDAPEHDHHDVIFLMEADDRIPLQISKESLNLAWVPLGDPRSVAESRQARLVAKTLDLAQNERRAGG